MNRETLRNTNELTGLPELLRIRIENAQARGSKISSIERIGDHFVAIYMYNPHGVFTLIQYADNILSMMHTPAGSIKRLYDDWEAS